MTEQSVGAWAPVRFSPADETAYRDYMRARIVPLLRIGALIGAGAFSGFFAWDYLLLDDPLWVTGPIRVAVVLFMLLGGSLSYWPVIRDDSSVLFVFTVCIYVGVAIGFAAIVSQLPGGFVAGLPGFMIGMIFIPAFVAYTWQSAVAVAPLIVVPIGIMAGAGATEFELVNAIAWLTGGASFVIGFSYVLVAINRNNFALELSVQREKQRSEDLLLNILPADIAERLKADETVIADHRESATVLFADLVGFTELSRTVSAARLVELLNDLFSRFDRLTQQHGAEKIKTIGDAYMVAAGLNAGVSDHVTAVANLALDMKDAFIAFQREHDLDLKLRIGVHSGAVIAGVIGTHKFAYDLWGDTVNVASRMESAGVPNEIQVSEETRTLLSPNFQVQPRGKIDIKGHLAKNVYLLRR